MTLPNLFSIKNILKFSCIYGINFIPLLKLSLNRINMSFNTNLKLVSDFIKQFDEVEKALAEVNKEHSDIDKAISKLYHNLEGTKLVHVSISHKFAIELQTLLHRRRDIKIEELVLRSTCDTLRVTITKLKETHKVQLDKNDALRQEIKDRAITRT